MPRLATLEEARRRSTRLTRQQRGEALEALRRCLEGREEVLLALAYGGILRGSKPVRDIDVAVYTGHAVPPSEWPIYVDELSLRLERCLRSLAGLQKRVDVVVLEYAPPGLRAAALRGLVLLERLPGLRARLLLRSLDELRGLARSRGGSTPRAPRPASS